MSGSRTRTAGARSFSWRSARGCRNGRDPPAPSSLGQQATATPAPSAPAVTPSPIRLRLLRETLFRPVLLPVLLLQCCCSRLRSDSISAPEGTASSSRTSPPRCGRRGCPRPPGAAEACHDSRHRRHRAREHPRRRFSAGANRGAVSAPEHPLVSDGRPGKKAGAGTDIWLACAIAVPRRTCSPCRDRVLPRAGAMAGSWRADRLTGGRWRAEFDDCPQQATQHVGLLWNRRGRR